jgi:hypothetical protein
MSKEKTNHHLDTAAKIISVVFHPILGTLYGLVIIFSVPDLFRYLPFAVKNILLFIVLVNNVLIPLSLMPYYRYRNIISSWTIENRKERYIPLIVTSIFYSVTSIIVFRFQIPFFLKSFLFASSFLAITLTIINFMWKISIHSAGTGALTALVFILALRIYSPIPLYLISILLAGGLVLTSRLRLNSHNPSQVWLGFLTGFTGLMLFMLFL